MITVKQIQQLFAGLPENQRVMFIDEDGLAHDIDDIDPFTITDESDETQILLLEFTLDGDRRYGFSGDNQDRINTQRPRK